MILKNLIADAIIVIQYTSQLLMIGIRKQGLELVIALIIFKL